MTTDELLLEIRGRVKDGTIANSSKQELEQYVVALTMRDAIDRFVPNQFPQVCETVRLLLSARISEEFGRESLKAREEISEKRHIEIQKKLEELKKPHRASFWLLVASVILAFVAAVAAILSVPQQQKVFSENPKSQTQKEQLQPSEPKSETSRLNKPKK